MIIRLIIGLSIIPLALALPFIQNRKTFDIVCFTALGLALLGFIAYFGGY